MCSSDLVRRELAALVPGFKLPSIASAPSPASSIPGQDRQEPGPAALAGMLAELDEAYEEAARASGPIVGSARWQGILGLIDALRDLNDELTAVTESGGELSAPARTLVRALSSAAARQIGALAKELAVLLGGEGLRHSPLWNGLRRLQRSAEAVATFGTPISPLTPSGYATGRGALQAQLGAMRRNLKAAPRSRPAAAA